MAALGTSSLGTIALSATAAALTVRVLCLIVSSLHMLILVVILCFRRSASTHPSLSLLLPSPYIRFVDLDVRSRLLVGLIFEILVAQDYVEISQAWLDKGEALLQEVKVYHPRTTSIALAWVCSVDQYGTPVWRPAKARDKVRFAMLHRFPL